MRCSSIFTTAAVSLAASAACMLASGAAVAATTPTDQVQSSVQSAPMNTADLVVKVTGPATAKTNDPIKYKITVTNQGPDAATDVRTVLGVTGVSNTATYPVTSNGSLKVGNSIVTGPLWTIPSLASGTTVIFTVEGQITAKPPGLVTAVAGVASDTSDPGDSNNSARLTTRIS